MYSVVAVALERFYNICKPFSRNLVRRIYLFLKILKNNIIQHPHFQGSIMDGQGYIITIIIFSILYNIVKFFEFETVTVLHEDEVSGEM